MSRLLLTGASGFVGRQVLEALAAGEHELHAVSRRERRSDGPVDWHVGDLLERGAATELIESVRPSHLIHLAWISEPGVFWTSPDNDRWLERSRELLEAFATAGGERAIIAGSCAEYDWSGEADLNEAGTALNPATPYGRAKLGLCLAAAELARRTGIRIAWARLFFLFGPGEHPDRLVASVARRVLAGEPAPGPPGTQLRDYLYVGEAGAALAALLESPIEGAVNIGSGNGTRIAELLEKVATEAGRPDLLELGALPMPNDDPTRLVADVRRLRDEVGWAPALELPEAIARTIGWWREQLSRADSPGPP